MEMRWFPRGSSLKIAANAPHFGYLERVKANCVGCRNFPTVEPYLTRRQQVDNAKERSQGPR
jgi:hypothetical protein